MAYQVDRRPITARQGATRVRIAVAIALALSVAIVGWLGARSASDAGLAVVEPRSASPDLTAPAATLTPAPWPAMLRPLATLAPPATVRCADVARRDCADALLAARAVLPPRVGPPIEATVSASLVCGRFEVCRQPAIEGARPVGSVVVTFGDGSAAWLNVVREPRGPLGRTGKAVAFVVRWTPSA